MSTNSKHSPSRFLIVFLLVLIAIAIVVHAESPGRFKNKNLMRRDSEVDDNAPTEDYETSDPLQMAEDLKQYDDATYEPDENEGDTIEENENEETEKHEEKTEEVEDDDHDFMNSGDVIDKPNIVIDDSDSTSDTVAEPDDEKKKDTTAENNDANEETEDEDLIPDEAKPETEEEDNHSDDDELTNISNGKQSDGEGKDDEEEEEEELELPVVKEEAHDSDNDVKDKESTSVNTDSSEIPDPKNEIEPPPLPEDDTDFSQEEEFFGEDMNLGKGDEIETDIYQSEIEASDALLSTQAFFGLGVLVLGVIAFAVSGSRKIIVETVSNWFDSRHGHYSHLPMHNNESRKDLQVPPVPILSQPPTQRKNSATKEMGSPSNASWAVDMSQVIDAPFAETLETASRQTKRGSISGKGMQLGIKAAPPPNPNTTATSPVPPKGHARTTSMSRGHARKRSSAQSELPKDLMKEHRDAEIVVEAADESDDKWADWDSKKSGDDDW